MPTKADGGFWKGPFCKVDAGARLFRHEKMGMLRPRARLGASTDPIKQKAQGHRDDGQGPALFCLYFIFIFIYFIFYFYFIFI